MSETLQPNPTEDLKPEKMNWRKEENLVNYIRPLKPEAEEQFRQILRNPQITRERRPWAEKLLRTKLAKVAVLAFGLKFLTADAPKAIAAEEPAPTVPAETIDQENLTDAQKEILKIDADRVALQNQMIRVFTPSNVETITNEDGTTTEKITASIDSSKTLKELTEDVASEQTPQEQISQTAKTFEESLQNAGISEEIIKEMMRKLFFDIQTISTKINPEMTWGQAQNELFSLERMTRKSGKKIGLTAEQIPIVIDAEKNALVNFADINVRLQLGFIPESSTTASPENPETTPPTES
ncbi:MAG: hypothetical protein COX39_00245 [Candidatus Nealsonbacteria bacterium CG23_combo_of_CG06-09_8_20_14_all_40_13]|uniref:Uncharacterized protein n=1 Tax=Candidatus Nealsonbacteria bacterium CG23_combo_of_CG06-09_8_20_14_all_40_13 TaxID=1974724 RepID=A0A2G9YRR9_9BACT|nr:MAG: hypothetical protein COX39_00245 [Candidatus Nealsonbacteria bacterium CG23_combo_of_CG06-09_8_20_14_all_40_13]